MNRSFASDNNAPIAPEILDAIVAANEGDAVGYGDDPWTARATAAFRAHFGEETDVYLTFNGTGANVIALGCGLQPWQSVLCPATAHLQTDECGAFERFTGSKCIPIVTTGGKLRLEDIEPHLGGGHGEHHSQVRAISISQATEYSDVYEVEEMREICDLAHRHDVFVHVDGARISNAAAVLGVTPRALTVDLGVDVLTFGGTKNGLMLGEAVLFFNPELSVGIAPYVRKQAMQLASKMRYVAAQFEALLAEDRWLKYASHANQMTALLQAKVREIEGIRVTRKTRCNAIFATLDRAAIERVQREFFFYLFDERLPEARWMTHWATTPADIDAFANALARATRAL